MRMREIVPVSEDPMASSARLPMRDKMIRSCSIRIGEADGDVATRRQIEAAREGEGDHWRWVADLDDGRSVRERKSEESHRE